MILPATVDGYDPKADLQHHPMPCRRFGVNPWGENLYRIVLTDSRRYLVCGKWNDSGTSRARWMPLYPHMLAQYVLEKWQDAFTFTGMTAEKWNVDPNCTLLGPYPSRGEYRMIGNTGIRPADTNIEKLIALVQAGANSSWAEKLQACRKQAEYAEAEAKRLRMDIIVDALPYKGTEALIGFNGGRGTKTAPILKSANELRLPRPTNQTQVNGGARMMTPRQAKRFSFPHRKVEIAIPA